MPILFPGCVKIHHSLAPVGGLRSYGGCCNANVTLIQNFALGQVFRDYSKLVTLYKIDEVYCRLFGANGFHTNVKSERFTSAGSRCRQNLKQGAYGSTTFARRRRLITSCHASSSCRNWSLRFSLITTTTLVGVRQISRLFFKYNFTRKVVESKMPNLRETRGYTTYAYRHKFINEQESAILYDPQQSTNPEFRNWNYERFDLDERTNDECMAEFRFYKEDIHELADQMQLLDEITTYNGLSQLRYLHYACI